MTAPNNPSPDPQAYMPLDYAPPRPTSVTVLAIIGIVFASLSLVVCFPLQLVSFFVPAVLEQQPGIAAIKNSKPLFALTLGLSAVNIALTVLLLVASIGSLKLYAWARQAMIASALLSIVMTIANMAAQFIFIFPVQFTVQTLPPGTPPEALGVMKGITYAMTVVISLIVMVLPAMILIFFRKPHVVDAFERRLRL